jgi:hypothetical protein
MSYETIFNSTNFINYTVVIHQFICSFTACEKTLEVIKRIFLKFLKTIFDEFFFLLE